MSAETEGLSMMIKFSFSYLQIGHFLFFIISLNLKEHKLHKFLCPQFPIPMIIKSQEHSKQCLVSERSKSSIADDFLGWRTFGHIINTSGSI